MYNYIHASYLEEFLVPRHFFFLTITTITMHNIKLIITTAVTAPAIVGTGVELEVDEPVIGDKGITTRIHIISFTQINTCDLTL